MLLSLFDGSPEYSGVVVATGGSAVYSSAGMKNLAVNAIIVYLDVPLAELRRRGTNYAERGVAASADQSFEDLFAERNVLYERYACVTMNGFGSSEDEVVVAIKTLVKI